MDVLTKIMPPALFTDKNLQCLVLGRMANLSLEHGNCDGSCLGYVWLGGVLGASFGDYRAGFRFGKLSVDLVEQRGLNPLHGTRSSRVWEPRHSLDEARAHRNPGDATRSRRCTGKR